MSMTKRRKVDASKVIEAVESGRVSKDLLDAYGVEKRQAEESAGPGRPRRGRKPKDSIAVGKAVGEIMVGKRGSLVLTHDILAELGCGQNERFVARRTKSGLVLKPA